MLQIRVHHMFLLWALIFICNIATAVYGQVNAELDKPFITNDGTAYRDKLTIASSKGVAQFAKAYNKRQRARVRYNKRKSKALGDQTPTFTTFGVGYDPNSHAAAIDKRFPGIDFTTSRQLRNSYANHKRERVQADRDESRLTNESQRRSQQALPRRQSTPRFRSQRPARPANVQPRFTQKRPISRQPKPIRPRQRRPKPRRPKPRRPSPNRQTPRRKRPRPVHRFQPPTTPRPTPKPDIRQIYGSTNIAGKAPLQSSIITSRVIIPAEEYYRNVYPSSDQQYQLDQSQIQPITSVPANIFSNHQQVASTPAASFGAYPEFDFSNYFYGPTSVNYGFAINHI